MANAPDYNSIFQAASGQAANTYAPVIAAEQGKEQGIKDRYAAAVQQLQGEKQQTVSGINTNTSREFGRRGIPLSSGVFDTTLTEKINPVNYQYAGLFSRTAADKENSLSDLAARVAGLRSTQNEFALKLASDRYGNELSSYEAALNRAAELERQRIASRASSGGGFTPTYSSPSIKAQAPVSAPQSQPKAAPVNASMLFGQILDQVKAKGGSEYDVWRAIDQNRNAWSSQGIDVNRLWQQHADLKKFVGGQGRKWY